MVDPTQQTQQTERINWLVYRLSWNLIMNAATSRKVWDSLLFSLCKGLRYVKRAGQTTHRMKETQEAYQNSDSCANGCQWTCFDKPSLAFIFVGHVLVPFFFGSRTIQNYIQKQLWITLPETNSTYQISPENGWLCIYVCSFPFGFWPMKSGANWELFVSGRGPVILHPCPWRLCIQCSNGEVGN